MARMDIDKLISTLPPERQTKIIEKAEAITHARAEAKRQGKGFAQPESHQYNTNFIAWCREQGAYLRARDFDQVDCENVAEEIESWARHFEDKLEQALSLLLAALLIPYTKPELFDRFSINSRELARSAVLSWLKDIDGLHESLPEILPDAWNTAVNIAATDLELEAASFPEKCPWSLVDVLREYWYPENCVAGKVGGDDDEG